MSSDGGKGSERYHARRQIPRKEMERKWEQTFGKDPTMKEVLEIIDEVNEKYGNVLKELSGDD